MTEEELKAIRKAAKRAKRIASEKASALHDLVEDRLPAAYAELPGMSQEAYDACVAWEKAEEELKKAEEAAA